MHHRKSHQELVHVEGLIEICDLPGFRNTPNEKRAIKQALARLTQVKKTTDKQPVFDIVPTTDRTYVLFVELDLGDVGENSLRSIAAYCVGRISQKAHQALLNQQLALVDGN